ncbi:P-loop NTPase fold protein [Streptomyces sp. NPDC093510]|uniref:P-loop NTPase fold protein n=1 Tax=Streptomyces sp. NPDC093510 TaxID=3155199 RepID=UPI0034461FC0
MDRVRSALVLATNDFQDPGLRSVQPAPTDAAAVSDVLTDPLIGGFEVRSVLDQPEASVRRELGRFFADRGRDDLLLLYLSSHGLKDDAGHLYFAASDTERDNLAVTAVSARFVAELMYGCRSRSIVIVLNCDYSGAFSRGVPDAFGTGSGWVIISSTSAYEYAFESSSTNGDHAGSVSVFAAAFVDGLRSGAADLDQDGLIAVDELFEYIRTVVETAQPQQRLTMQASVSDRIIIAQNPRHIGPLPADVAGARAEQAMPQTAAPPGHSAEPTPAPTTGPEQPDDAYTPEPTASNDYWTTVDELGYQPYAIAISEFIRHEDTAPPLTIGVKGPWGAGKTSLMRMAQDSLDPLVEGGAPANGGRRRWLRLSARSRGALGSWRQGRRCTTTEDAVVTHRSILRVLRNAASPAPDATDDGLRIDDSELSSHWRPTVWFNPWMHQTSEQIWAGLAHEIISQLTERMRPADREAFWLSLNLRRLDADLLRRRIHRALLDRLLPPAIALVGAGLVGAVLYLLRMLAPAVSGLFGVLGTVVLGGGVVGATVTGVVRAFGFGQERVTGSLTQVVRQPDYAQTWKQLSVGLIRNPGYESQLGPLHLIQTDMRRVLDLVATEDRPVVVFVDDLDRCSSSTVVQVVEAINLFLAGQFPNCVFVVAMEPEMVAAHIEVAYEPLVQSLTDVDYWDEAGRLGWRFLDKIVQLPVSLPSLRSDQASRFLGTALVGATGHPPPARPAPQANAGTVDRLEAAIRQRAPSLEEIPSAVASAQQQVEGALPATGRFSPAAQEAMRGELRRQLRPDNPEVQLVVATVVGHLTSNPREIKRFVNVFRFYAVIRQERVAAGLPAPDTLAAIAKLAVLAVRWPHLRAALGRQIGPTERDTVLALLEAPIAELQEDASWPERREALQAVLAEATIPETLRSNLLASEDLCRLLATAPSIGTAAAGYL